MPVHRVFARGTGTPVRTDVWFPVFVSLVLMACAHDTAPKAVVTPNAASSASDPDTSPPPGTIQTARERDIDAGEVRLHVRIAGDEHAPRTLLVVHGGPGASYEYITGLDALAGPQRRVVYVDERGVAPSTKPPSGDYRLEAHVADLEAVRAALGADRVDLLGHSWGTVPAGAFAARHPERVQTLTLMAPLALTSEVQKRSFEKLSAHEDSLVPLGLASAHPPEPVGDDCTARDRARLRRYFANARDPQIGTHGAHCYVEARTKSFEAIDGLDLTPTFAQVRGPVLLIVGAEDPFGREPLEQVRSALSSANVTVLTLLRCGHFPPLEVHAEFIEKFGDWLASPPNGR